MIQSTSQLIEALNAAYVKIIDYTVEEVRSMTPEVLDDLYAELAALEGEISIGASEGPEYLIIRVKR